MKLDYTSIEEVERNEKVTLLYRVKTSTPYIYAKIKRVTPDSIIYFVVKTARGKDHIAPFIRNEDLQFLFDKKKKEVKRKRGFIGRPFSFCEGCWAKDSCSESLPCAFRDKKREIKEAAKKVEGDDRFWKNGVPKKHLVLCKYAKYMYAHKKTAGQCQKEKCRFYVEGKCELNLDKE